MNIKEVLGIIGIIVLIAGYIPYIKDTISGKTTPHIFSWFLWGFMAFIAFGIQYSHQAGPSAWITLATSIISFFIGFVSLKNGSRDVKPLDYLFLSLAIISLILWRVIKAPEIATIFQLSAGVIALGPTIRKTWIKPYEETFSTWVLNSIRHGITLSAVENYSINTALHPFVWVIANSVVVIIIIIRKKQLNKLDGKSM